MAKTSGRLILTGLFLVGVSAHAVAQEGGGLPDSPRREVTGNLAESLSIKLSASFLQLLLQFKQQAPVVGDVPPSRSELDAALKRMHEQAEVPLNYLALSDAHGNIMASSPTYTLPEEWGIGHFSRLCETVLESPGGRMHYVPALLDRPATAAFLFPLQAPRSPGEERDASDLVMMVLLDSQAAFQSLLNERLLLPWESIRIWGPDGAMLYQQGAVLLKVMNPVEEGRTYLSRPALPEPGTILEEPSGAYRGQSFFLEPFKAVEHRIYWHRSVFIGGDRWVVTDVIEKPLDQGALPGTDLTGLWVAESGPSQRLVAVQDRSTWRMLLSLDGKVIRAGGRILNGALAAYTMEGVNVTSGPDSLRGELDARAGRLELNWLVENGRGIEARNVMFYRYRGDDVLPAPDPHRIRFRVAPVGSQR